MGFWSGVGNVIKKANPIEIVKELVPAVGLALEIGGAPASLALKFLGKKLIGNEKIETIDEVAGFIEEAATSNPQYLKNLDIEYQKLLLESNINLIELRNKNMADARQLYMHKSEMADYIAKYVIRFSLPLIVLLIVSASVMYFYGIKDPLIYALISGAITQLYNERVVLLNFFFGSSLGSKVKDDILGGKKDV